MQLEPILPKYESYIRDESNCIGQAEGIFFPHSLKEAQAAVLEAKQAQKSLTVQGARTSFLGGAVPNGGYILNLSSLQGIGALQDNILSVEAGVSLAELQKAILPHKLYFPVEPSEDTATLGGMFATGASGFGRARMQDAVEAIDFLTYDGVLHTIKRGDFPVENGLLSLPNGQSVSIEALSFPLYKNTATDLLDVLCGSESYFGIVLRLWLRLSPLPQEFWGVVFFFDEEKDAAIFADQAKAEAAAQTEARLCTAEFYNAKALSLLRAHMAHPQLKALPPLPSSAQSALYIELSGATEDGVLALLGTLLEQFEEMGGKEEATWAESGSFACAPFRAMRHTLVSILNETEDFYKADGFRRETDVIFLAHSATELFSFYQTLCRDFQKPAVLYGSILDGQLFCAPVAAMPEDFYKRFREEVQAKGGRLGAKYAFGRAKRAYLWQTLSAEQKNILEEIQKSL